MSFVFELNLNWTQNVQFMLNVANNHLFFSVKKLLQKILNLILWATQHFSASLSPQ